MSKVTEFILEIIGWLQIALGATLIGGLLALPIYLRWPTKTGILISLAVLIIGFVFGVVWATVIWRKHGTIAWLSRIRKIT